MEPYILLSESGTAYGSQNIRGLSKDGKGPRPITIRFPLHLALIRATRDAIEQQRKAAASGSLASLLFRRATIPDEETSPLDVVPSFDPAMTARTDDIVLENILTTIARKHVRRVGIIASDVRDIVFLGGEIHKVYPDVQIFLLGGDLMMTLRGINHDFRGAIVASSYPLDARLQDLTFPYRGHDEAVLFDHDVEMGCYNAAVVLIECPAHGTDQLEVPISRALNLLSYGPPYERPVNRLTELRPPTWINIVGQHDLWPVESRPAYGDDYVRLVPAVRMPVAGPPNPNTPANLPRTNFSPAFSLVLQRDARQRLHRGVAVGAIAFALASLWPLGDRYRDKGSLDFLASLHDADESRAAKAHAFAALGLVGIALPLAYAARVFDPVWMNHWPEDMVRLRNWGDHAIRIAVLVTLAAIAGALVVLVLRRKWPNRPGPIQAGDGATVLLVLGFAVGFGLVFLAAGTADFATGANRLLADRADHDAHQRRLPARPGVHAWCLLLRMGANGDDATPPAHAPALREPIRPHRELARRLRT